MLREKDGTMRGGPFKKSSSSARLTQMRSRRSLPGGAKGCEEGREGRDVRQINTERKREIKPQEKDDPRPYVIGSSSAIREREGGGEWVYREENGGCGGAKTTESLKSLHHGGTARPGKKRRGKEKKRERKKERFGCPAKELVGQKGLPPGKGLHPG